MLSMTEILTLSENDLLDKIVEEAAETIQAALKMKRFGERATGATFKEYDNLGQIIEEHAQVDLYLRVLARRHMRDMDVTMMAMQAMEADQADLFMRKDIP